MNRSLNSRNGFVNSRNIVCLLLLMVLLGVLIVTSPEVLALTHLTEDWSQFRGPTGREVGEVLGCPVGLGLERMGFGRPRWRPGIPGLWCRLNGLWVTVPRIVEKPH